jgi:hypothetical protein
MKTKFQILMLVVALFPLVGSATSTVCSSETLYYSNVRHDFGTQPLPGMETGRRVITYDGQILVNRVIKQSKHEFEPYAVTLTGEAKVLFQEGNQVFGSSIFTQTAVLTKISLENPEQGEEIARQPVVCRSTWAMVP